MVTAKINAVAKNVLDEREYQIIKLRFGLGGCTPQTQHKVAEFLNISRSYISRIESTAVKKLRRAIDFE